MALPAENPPLLLTKRLTTFLHANRTPQLPTLLVTTPTGKLLAHAGSQPVAILRTHATIAASLLSIHSSSSPSLPSALPGSRSPPPEDDQDDSDETEDEAYTDDDEDHDTLRTPAPRDPLKPVTITVQLSGGTVLIRRLTCGLLFVCIGQSSTSQSTSPHGHTGDATAAAEGTQQSHGENGDTLAPAALSGTAAPPAVSTSPSDVDSLVSAGAQTTTSLDSQGATAVVAMRRHATEMARWLDDKLGTLVVPNEGVGVE